MMSLPQDNQLRVLSTPTPIPAIAYDTNVEAYVTVISDEDKENVDP